MPRAKAPEPKKPLYSVHPGVLMTQRWVTAVADIDAEVRQWLRAAYDLDA